MPGALLLSVVFVGLAYALAPLPKTSDVATAQSTVVLDRAGRPIARLHAEVDRVDVPFEEMPEHLRDAVLVAEDRDFYEHGGVSPAAVVRAAITNVVKRDVVQGGSTITQQYVKNAYVGSKRTLWRKFKEAIVATKVERSLSKDQILHAYLNTVYFGRGAYGVEAAARTFFGKPASKLTLVESAYLAGAIRSPETYARDLALGEERRNSVLRAMAKLGKITEEEAVTATETKLRIVPPKGNAFEAVAAQHFVEDVRKQLSERFGSDVVYRGGLRVTTTLDLRWQYAAEAAVRETLDRETDPQAALVSVDPATGAVRAMVGGRDFAKLQLNLATQGRRQPGSAFKPFVLASALDDGMAINSRFRAPARISLETGFQPWTVGNYDLRDYGTLDLVQATANSVNTVFAQLILKVGPSKTVTAAHAAGVTSKLRALPSLALGTELVTPVEMAGAYATLAASGTHSGTHLVTKVVDASGDVLLHHKPERVRGLSDRTANNVTYALRRVVENGTGRSAAFGRPAAGKTGTTEEHGDAWFAGYTPDLATVVWMGYPESRRPMKNVHGIEVTGGSFPARIWRQFMAAAHEDLKVREFPKPDLGATPPTEPVPATVAPSASPSATTVPASPSPGATPSATPGATPPGSPSPSQSPKPKPTGSASPSPSPSPAPS